MGTRLLSEYSIKQRHPYLRYVRVHTLGRHRAAIYAWNNDLQLPEHQMATLKQFAADHLLPHVCFAVKPYHMVQTDEVPPVRESPKPIVDAAMNRSLNQQGIVEVMQSMFPSSRLTFNKYDFNTATVHFDVHSTSPVTDIEKELVDQYLYELIPIGSRSSVTYLQCSSQKSP
ncbi:hypothetical protein [Paenibacillus xerothermodurans]|uniref:Uncharacterized protein n=1 Tax=Paenibacillus xerothermodurans TaxID=1977292 RepID=A0A2W1NX94_PAEXE|nr:hypothetical protein [Paenibacillus xerothermodurans]PZE22346.1 hypothetical protein CBW46_000720 [Paenibacillus xerothermodurans]